MIVNFDEYLVESLINETVLNEELDLSKIQDIVDKVRDKGETISKLIKRFNETNNMTTKKYLSTILVLLFIGNLVMKSSIWSDTPGGNSVDKIATKLASEKTIDIKMVSDAAKTISMKTANKISTIPLDIKKIKAPLDETMSKIGIDVSKAVASNSVKNFIKNHEKLKLKAYYIGDDRITIGYGHSANQYKSPYKVGDEITKEKAEKLFVEDIIKAENGVRRLFEDWSNDGININITQGMFDSMVSMAFNMGVTGFRNCDFLHDLKGKDYLTAAEKIKITKVTSTVTDKDGKKKTVKMPGLIDRRAREYSLFIRDLLKYV